MTDIYSVSLSDILPESLKSDPLVKALAEAITPEIQAISKEMVQCILLPRIDELPEEIVDHLAWQMHVDWYDADLDISIKRNLIKDSKRWHQIKGTPAAIEEVAATVFGRSWVEEWFDYGGNPYRFRVNVEASQQGASQADLIRLESLVNQYKNARSRLDTINIYLTSSSSAYLSAAMVTGEEITVYPWTTREIDGNVPLMLGIGCQSVETLTVNPM